MFINIKIKKSLLPLLKEAISRSEIMESTGSDYLDGLYRASIAKLKESVNAFSEEKNPLDGIAEGYSLMPIGGPLNVVPKRLQETPKISREVPVQDRVANDRINPLTGKIVLLFATGGDVESIAKEFPDLSRKYIAFIPYKFSEEIEYMKTLSWENCKKYAKQRFNYTHDTVVTTQPVRVTYKKPSARVWDHIEDTVPEIIALRASGMSAYEIAGYMRVDRAYVMSRVATYAPYWRELQSLPQGEARYKKLKSWFPNWSGLRSGVNGYNYSLEQVI